MSDILSSVSHRKWPLPDKPWAMTQRWNDLMFAHWPVPAAEIAYLLPEGVEVDTFDGSAWVGIVPFWMDAIRMRGMPAIPGANRFPELNLRTYVRERNTNSEGVYFFSLDAGNPLAVAFARAFYHLPYYWANMKIFHRTDGSLFYRSERKFGNPARFHASYRSLRRLRVIGQSRPGTIEYFLTERYALYTADKRGRLLKGNIHHLPWPLEAAEAEIEVNELPLAHGIRLPDMPPLVHYARQLSVYVWALEPARALGMRSPATASQAPQPAAPPISMAR